MTAFMKIDKLKRRRPKRRPPKRTAASGKLICSMCHRGVATWTLGVTRGHAIRAMSHSELMSYFKSRSRPVCEACIQRVLRDPGIQRPTMPASASQPM